MLFGRRRRIGLRSPWDPGQLGEIRSKDRGLPWRWVEVSTPREKRLFLSPSFHNACHRGNTAPRHGAGWVDSSLDLLDTCSMMGSAPGACRLRGHPVPVLPSGAGASVGDGYGAPTNGLGRLLGAVETAVARSGLVGGSGRVKTAWFWIFAFGAATVREICPRGLRSRMADAAPFGCLWLVPGLAPIGLRDTGDSSRDAGRLGCRAGEPHKGSAAIGVSTLLPKADWLIHSPRKSKRAFSAIPRLRGRKTWGYVGA
jgi:hypothetical protein